MDNTFSFAVTHRDTRSHARCGEIKTPHGSILTPAFVPVGTQGSVKSLSPEEIETVGTQLFFVNTYHMYLRPGIAVVKKHGGLHSFMNWQHPLITDSGGFQVFSLARGRRKGSLQTEENVGDTGLVRIREEDVQFQSHWDGSYHRFTPESSMQWQWDLGSDIHIAFDDCTSYPVNHEQARFSMERTHRWVKRSVDAHTVLSRTSTGPYQAIYGSVQGSVYQDLRQISAEYIRSLSVDGIAIGGVSVGESKEEMVAVLSWVMPLLPEGKPRHLLGVGEIDDIFSLIEAGVDTFDCVQPTRLARMGWVFSREISYEKEQKFTLDITKSQYAEDMRPIESTCSCYTCTHFSRAYVHHLFHVKELFAYRLASIHNLTVMHTLVTDIRHAIVEGTFLDLKRKWVYDR